MKYTPMAGTVSYKPNGRFALIRASSVLSTLASLLKWRFRFAFFAESRWRRDACARITFPRAVILNRFATAFFVLLLAIGFGIRRAR